MSQRPVVELPPQSSSTSGLKPALQAALATLDIQLDEELARYRRSYSGPQRQPMPQNLRRDRRKHKPLDLISIDVNKPLSFGNSSQQRPRDTSSPMPTVDINQQGPKDSSSPVPTVDTNQEPSADTSGPSPNIHSNQQPPAAFSYSLSVVSSDEEQTRTSEQPPIEPASGHLVDSSSSHPEPDDYLESSEALLRSISEDQTPTPVRPNDNALLTPLGIGSMLLLLLASATLGYIAINPTTLRLLNLAHRPNPNSLTNSPSAASNAQQPVNTISQSEEPPSVANYPNLASREFVDLNLNTLSTVKPNSIVQPTPSPTPVAAKPTPSTIPGTVQILTAKNLSRTQPQKTSETLPSVHVQQLAPLPKTHLSAVKKGKREEEQGVNAGATLRASEAGRTPEATGSRDEEVKPKTKNQKPKTKNP